MTDPTLDELRAMVAFVSANVPAVRFLAVSPDVWEGILRATPAKASAPRVAVDLGPPEASIAVFVQHGLPPGVAIPLDADGKPIPRSKELIASAMHDGRRAS